MNIFEFVKSKVSILDVVNEYVTLKPAGRYWKGPSPFKHEKVPSFTVSPHKEIYYCFSSGQGGDVIQFITAMENCTPLEAARYLIDRHKLQIPATVEWNKAAVDVTKKTTYETACDFFAQWCHGLLAKNKNATAYLEKRGVAPAIIDQFMIGYCPLGEEQLRQLISQAQKHNILLQDFFDAQILMDGKHSIFCPFEDRIIFPIYNHVGACCGFGGRVFRQDDTRAKYYNSHDHAYFNKSSILFGLHNAKKSIQKSGNIFLVEGYLDCIAMAQAGYTNSIATLGTACTVDHLKQIARYAQKLYVVYDGDEAGQKAMIRLAELCWQVNLELFVVTLPAAEDPASFLMAGKNLQPLITDAATIFTFFISHMGRQFFAKSLQERIATINNLLETIAQLPDPLQKDLLLQQMATTFDTPIETLKKQLLRKKVQVVAPDGDQDPQTPAPAEPLPPLEKKLFSAILNNEMPLEPLEEKFLIEHMSPSLVLLLQKYRDHTYRFAPFFNAITEEEQRLVTTVTMEHGQETSPALFRKLLHEFFKKHWKTVVYEMKIKLSHNENSSREMQQQLLREFNELKKNIMGKGIL